MNIGVIIIGIFLFCVLSIITVIKIGKAIEDNSNIDDDKKE